MGWGSALAAGVLLSLGCSIAANAIIMGRLVKDDEAFAQSTVMVLHAGFLESGRGQCSGTMVGEDLILTAAHCVVNLQTGETFPATHFRVYFGNYSGEQKDWQQHRALEVSHVSAHPDYNAKADATLPGPVHDIALMKVSGHAPDTFHPAPLLKDLSLLKEGQKVFIAGYGNIKFYGDPEEPRSRLLRKFETNILSNRSPFNGMVTFLRPTTVKSQEDMAKAIGGMAAGDSGGPGYIEVNAVLTVFGVASGYRDDKPSYENVPDHWPWLEKTAAAFGSKLK